MSVRRQEGWTSRALCALAAAVVVTPGCAPWPVEGCHRYVDAYARRLADCEVYRTYGAAAAAVTAALTEHPEGCGAATDIVLPDLWFDECLPQLSALECDELDALPNACRGQLVFAPPP